MLNNDIAEIEGHVLKIRRESLELVLGNVGEERQSLQQLDFLELGHQVHFHSRSRLWSCAGRYIGLHLILGTVGSRYVIIILGLEQ